MRCYKCIKVLRGKTGAAGIIINYELCHDFMHDFDTPQDNWLAFLIRTSIHEYMLGSAHTCTIVMPTTLALLTL